MEDKSKQNIVHTKDKMERKQRGIIEKKRV